MKDAPENKEAINIKPSKLPHLTSRRNPYIELKVFSPLEPQSLLLGHNISIFIYLLKIKIQKKGGFTASRVRRAISPTPCVSIMQWGGLFF